MSLGEDHQGAVRSRQMRPRQVALSGVAEDDEEVKDAEQRLASSAGLPAAPLHSGQHSRRKLSVERVKGRAEINLEVGKL
jgi:hypothetical protein